MVSALFLTLAAVVLILACVNVASILWPAPASAAAKLPFGPHWEQNAAG